MKFISSEFVDDLIFEVSTEINNRTITFIYVCYNDDGCFEFVEFSATGFFPLENYIKGEDYSGLIESTLFNRDLISDDIQKFKPIFDNLGITFDELINYAEIAFNHKKNIFELKTFNKNSFFFPH